MSTLALLLTATAACVVGFALGTAYGSRRARAGQHAPQRAYACTCGMRFYDEAEAKRHAVKTHNAPEQDDEWRHIVDEVEVYA